MSDLILDLLFLTLSLLFLTLTVLGYRAAHLSHTLRLFVTSVGILAGGMWIFFTTERGDLILGLSSVGLIISIVTLVITYRIAMAKRILSIVFVREIQKESIPLADKLRNPQKIFQDFGYRRRDDRAGNLLQRRFVSVVLFQFAITACIVFAFLLSGPTIAIIITIPLVIASGVIWLSLFRDPQ